MHGTDGVPDREGVRLGRWIRNRRGALNMTQPELAERAGVSLAYVYMLEVGALPEPGLQSLLRVARAVDDTRLAELLEEVQATQAGGQVPPSVEAVATSTAIARFLREVRA
jgi:transcriptional regulator with XRE-family HTH domain